MRKLLVLLTVAVLSLPLIGCEIMDPADTDNINDADRTGINDIGRDRPDGSEPMRDRDFDGM